MAQRRVREAILAAGAEILHRNSDDKAHSAYDNSQLACFRTSGYCHPSLQAQGTHIGAGIGYDISTLYGN
jgi:hypothetical protein